MLSRTRDKERTRAERALKQQTSMNEKLQHELDEQVEDLERKEKLVKLQVFEVKRLKRQLKDLVSSSKPIATPLEHPVIPTRPTPSSSSSSSSTYSKKRKTPKKKRPQPHLKRGVLGPEGGGGEGNRSGGSGGSGNAAACDENTAATKVQTSFRGLKSRKTVKEMRREKEEKSYAGSKIQATYRGRATRKRVQQQKKQMNGAAATMQSNFRGYKTRREMSATKDQRKRDLAFQRQLEYQNELNISAAEK